MADIKIIVNEGRVEAVYASDRNIHVEIIDKDVGELAEMEDEQEIEDKIEALIQDLYQVF